VIPVAVKPYLSIAELAERTPWSEKAIRRMISRGSFKAGVHYFQPSGVGGQVIFAWAKVVEYIEQQEDGGRPSKLPKDVRIDLDELRKKAQSLLG
jgi:hypothetical protein